MGKREIKVEVIGQPSEKALNSYYEMMWRTIEEKYGIEFLLEVQKKLQEM